jgi:hypothetical protein
VKKLIPHPFCCCSILPKFMGPTIMVWTLWNFKLCMSSILVTAK